MKKYKRKKNRNLIKWLILIFAILSTMTIGYSYFTDTLFINISANILPAVTDTYTVIFDANSGTGTMNPQSIGVGIPTNLTLNAFEKPEHSFECWTTMPDGTGTSFDDGEAVTDLVAANESITLYVKWRYGVARIGSNYYPTLQDAINAVPTNNTETTVELLANVSENISIIANKNIVLDLKNHTVSSADKSVVVNKGTIKMTNGTILSTANNESAFDNRGGTFYISGGQIIMTNPDGKQAIYNDGGTLEISGSAYIKSASSETGLNPRAAVHNINNGKINVIGGTIISEGHWGINNASGTLIVGTKDDDPNLSTPIIQGKTLGITSTPNYKFYNGIIRGVNNATNNDSKITEVETGFSITHREEEIEGIVYKEIYLSQSTCKVTFNPNGGTTNEPTRTVEIGHEIGALPTPTRSGYDFIGWFTDPNNGTQIDANEIISANVTFYAHWLENAAAEINGTKYSTLQAAINSVPTNNTLTTIKVLKNVSETLTVANNKNIVLDIQSYQLKNNGSNVAVITNNGTIEMISGTITTNATTGAINNNSGATFKISGGSIIATGARQAIYNSGTAEISGTAYLSSGTTGTQQGYTLSRGTVQNLSTGTLNITGGTIIGTKQLAVSNEGTMTIGIKDGSISNTSPIIQGETYGIVSNNIFNYYDGTIKGISGAISGSLTEIETGAQIMNGSEVIDGKTYITEFLQ